MQNSIVRPLGRDMQNVLIGFVGEHEARTFFVRTRDDLTGYTISLVIGDVDCGAMTKAPMPDGSTMLSLTLTSDMLGNGGDKVCQLLMVKDTIVRKSSQFRAYVGASNDINSTAPDSATIIIISEKITELVHEAALDAIAEVQEVIDSIPADYSTLSAQVDTNTEDIGGLKAGLQFLYAHKDSSDFSWTVGKTIGSNGKVGTNDPTALTDKFAVTPGCTITNKSDAVGMNDKPTIFMVAQFEGNTFKSRTNVNAGESLVLDNDTDSVMLVFGYAGSSHNVETQEDVDAHFKVIIAEPLATVREVETIEAGVENIFTRTSYGRQIADNPGALTTETVDGVEVTTLHLDLVLLPGKYLISENHIIDGAPTGFTPQFIIVDNLRYVYSTRFLRQTIGGITRNPDTIYHRFTNFDSVWQGWQLRAGTTQIDNSYTYNNENTYESNVTQNSYTVSASPSITTDNLYYLAPSGDTTDRTTDIATILNTNGICRLGSGTYYVSNLQMPNNSQIIGVGASTVIRLADSVTDGYAIRMGERCTVKDCTILGSESYTPMVESAVTPGNRVGVLWYGADNVLPYYGVLDNVRIGRFAGSGIKLYNTSKQAHTKLTATNCYIEYCDVGINIAYISEFNQFANCTIRKCYYGAINNGGNNTFSTCEFCSNIIHFLIDNSSGTMENNAHSGITNCVFGHAMGFVDHVLTSNKGTAIKIIGVDAGFIFTSCYNGYGKTEIEDSSGILFNGCMWSGYSNNDIKIVRGGGITFATCLFTSLPPITITDNTSVVSHGCRLKSGADVVVE